jgi:hypothetical protein
MKSWRFNMRQFNQTLRAALLQHGMIARCIRSPTRVVWNDGAGRFNTGKITVYLSKPFLVRLVLNNSQVVIRGCYRQPEAPMSEITFRPSESLLLADKIAKCMARGDLVKPYVFTQAAWQFYPYKGPYDDLQNGSLSLCCLEDGAGLSYQY